MSFEKKKRRTVKVSLKRRQQLIQMVLEAKKSITYAAKKLRLKYSTARTIVCKQKEKDVRRDIQSIKVEEKESSEVVVKVQEEVNSQRRPVSNQQVHYQQNGIEEPQQAPQSPIYQNMFFFIQPYYHWPTQ